MTIAQRHLLEYHLTHDTTNNTLPNVPYFTTRDMRMQSFVWVITEDTQEQWSTKRIPDYKKYTYVNTVILHEREPVFPHKHSALMCTPAN